MRLRFGLLVALLLVVAACADDTTTTGDGVVTDNGTRAEAATSSQAPTGDDTMPPADTTPPMESLPPLPADPQRVEFAAADGHRLVGHYYPAAMNPAPLVVLMHWAGGDERDWVAIAPWLQNRHDELPDTWMDGIGADCGEQMEGPWLDSTWFPPMPPGASFGVFTFDFRDFCESEPGLGDPSEWALDAQAAFDTAAALEGVDSGNLVAIGASIGADGAPDGCLLHNLDSATCLGGFSLSPGEYLQGTHFEPPYAETVATLDGAEPPIPVWCLASDDDTPARDACLSASGRAYVQQIYSGGDHGMVLVRPDLDPNPLVLVQEFLEIALGVDLR